MVVLKNQNRRSGIFYLRPLCGFGFFSKSDFSAIFGEAYGLSIESEPDIGTTVTIRLPGPDSQK